MDIQLLEILRCSQCHSRLHLKVYAHVADSDEAVQAGLLTCATCGMLYAIWRGVPRMNLEEDFRLPRGFVAEYKDRLGEDVPTSTIWKQKWETNAYDVSWSLDYDGACTWGLDLATRLSYFYHYLQVPPGSLKGQRILDAGCGNGVLSAALAKDGPEVVAFDYSDIVVRAETTRQRTGQDGRVHYLQADVRYPPFADASFDVIYSDGVIHYTGDTRAAFHSLACLVKQHGRLFVSVSRRASQSTLRAAQSPG